MADVDPQRGPTIELTIEQRDQIRALLKGSGMDSQQQVRFANQLASILGIDPAVIRPV